MRRLKGLLDGTVRFMSTGTDCHLCKSELQISLYEWYGTLRMELACDYHCQAGENPLRLAGPTPSCEEVVRLFDQRLSRARELGKLIADHAVDLVKLKREIDKLDCSPQEFALREELTGGR